MGIKIRDHLDIDDLDFSDMKLFKGYVEKLKEELKQKQKAGRRLDANIEKYLRETSKGH